MKYMCRLISRKCWKILAMMLPIFGIGFFLVFSVIYDCMNGQSLYYDSTSLLPMTSYVALLGASGVGRIILGVFLMYAGTFGFAQVTWQAQNREDLDVQADEEYVYVSFEKWSWKLKREKMGATDYLFFDANHRFVTVTRAYQVDTAVLHWYPELVGKASTQVDENQLSTNIREFAGLHLAGEQEKKDFIERTGRNKAHVLGKVFGICFWLMAAVIALGAVVELGNGWKSTLGSFVMALFCFALGYPFYQSSARPRRERKWILEHELYTAEGGSYKKKESNSDSGNGYYVKIWDQQGTYLERWYEINQKAYESNEVVKMKIYAFVDEKGKEQVEAY